MLHYLTFFYYLCYVNGFKMKTLKIAFGAALILGVIFFPAHMIIIGMFLVAVVIAVGLISIALKGNDSVNSSISDDEAFMVHYLLKKKKEQ
jgi:hypothetical protein|nr:MAG TPA: hypothetical protein [Caudoviricetes sp.]